MKRGGPLRRGKPPTRRKRLAPRSSKRIGEADDRRRVVEEVVARDGHWCAAYARVPQIVCSGPLDADEWDLRSAKPGGHLDPANVQMLCRAHHDWKHAEPIQAAHAGLRPYPVGYTGPRRPGSGPRRPLSER